MVEQGEAAAKLLQVLEVGAKTAVAILGEAAASVGEVEAVDSWRATVSGKRCV